MEIFSNPIVAFVVLIGILVFVHELGHYLVGVMFGVGVRTFSIGFGPRLGGFIKNGTDFSVRVLPLGGFVQFAGALPSEEVEDHFQGKEYWRAKPWQRALILLAGPLANILMAVGVYAVIGNMGVEHPPSIVGGIKIDSPADKAGLQSGDKIVSIDGQAITKWEELTTIIKPAFNRSLEITIDRDGSELTTSIIPEAFKAEALNGDPIEIGRIGIEMGMAAPIIAIASQNGLDKGFLAGDKILKITSGKKTIEPLTWHDVEVFIGRAELSSPLKFELEKFSLKKDEKSPSRTLEVQLVEGEQAFYQLGIKTGRQLIAEMREKDTAVKVQDLLVEVKGKRVGNRYDLMNAMDGNTDQMIPVSVERVVDGVLTELAFNLKLTERDIQKPTGKETIFVFPFALTADAMPESVVEQYSGIVDSLGYGFRTTVSKSVEMVGHIAGLFTGEIPLKALGGPILIAQVASTSVQLGLQTFLATVAAISINLGLINLVPIPALDGGQLVVVGAEAIRRKPLSEQAIENIQRVGAVMVMALVVLAFYNDLGRFWKSMLSGVTGGF